MKQFNRFLPEKPIIENDDFVIYGNNDLLESKEKILDSLMVAKRELLDFFGFDSFEKIPVNLFNSRETYLYFTRQFYEPSLYSMGNFTNGMISYFYDVNNINRLIRNIIHEMVHLFYQHIWDGKYERIVWLDEGLAQYLSHEKMTLEKDAVKFKEWYLSTIIGRFKKIPKIDFLREHGSGYGKFVDNEQNSYDGYNISYLIIRYIVDSGIDIASLLRNIKDIKELESNVLTDAIKYYNKLFSVDKIKQNFDELETPEELMDYMNLNTVYGWIDNDGLMHIGNLKGFRENYRTCSFKTTIETGLGTCIEQAYMIKIFFDKIGLQNKMFCYRRFETEENFDKDVRMHCFVVFFYNNKWYHFEHSDSANRGIHEYESLDEALKEITFRPDKSDIRELTEIPEVPAGLSFKEFNDYVNNFMATPAQEYKKKI